MIEKQKQQILEINKDLLDKNNFLIKQKNNKRELIHWKMKLKTIK